MNIKNVCIFSSSSNLLDKTFYDDAKYLGELLGKNSFNVVYGGSKLGLMYTVSKYAKESGSKVIGIMPQKLYDFGFSENFCDEFYITDGMRERKALLDKKSDAIIALPGGFGTLEEISEMIVQKQLSYNQKPIIFLNTNGFYNELFNFFDKIIHLKFANESAKTLFYIAKTPLNAISYLQNYNAPMSYKIPNKYLTK